MFVKEIVFKIVNDEEISSNLVADDGVDDEIL
jgi:hypothetical protein